MYYLELYRYLSQNDLSVEMQLTDFLQIKSSVFEVRINFNPESGYAQISFSVSGFSNYSFNPPLRADANASDLWADMTPHQSRVYGCDYSSRNPLSLRCSEIELIVRPTGQSFPPRLRQNLFPGLPDIFG